MRYGRRQCAQTTVVAAAQAMATARTIHPSRFSRARGVICAAALSEQRQAAQPIAMPKPAASSAMIRIRSAL